MTKKEMIEIIFEHAIITESKHQEEFNSQMESLIRKLDLTKEFEANRNLSALALSYFN